MLDEHIIVSVDDPKKNNVVGSTGTDAALNGEFLQNSIVVWDASAIARIESGEQKELSCAYRYTAVNESGSFKGIAYDLKMKDIIANHVALVKEGRAGPDVVVADGKLGEVRMKFSAVKPILAAKFATDSALNTVSRLALFAALDAMESDCDAEDEFEEADAEEKVRAKAEEEKAKDKKRAKDKAAKDKAARDKAAKDAEKDDDEDDDDTAAKDAAIKIAAAVKLATDAAVKDTVARLEAVQTAKDAVRPIVGEVHGMDSADAVYKFALDAKGVDVTGVHPSAYPALIKMIPTGAIDTKIVYDHAAQGKVAALFPSLARYA